MPDTILSTWHKLMHLIPTTTPRVGTIFIPLLWIRKLRHKDIELKVPMEEKSDGDGQAPLQVTAAVQ